MSDAHDLRSRTDRLAANPLLTVAARLSSPLAALLLAIGSYVFVSTTARIEKTLDTITTEIQSQQRQLAREMATNTGQDAKLDSFRDKGIETDRRLNRLEQKVFP